MEKFISDSLIRRLKNLNYKEVNKNKEVVIYWMQASQREEYNEALEFAIYQANFLNKPLIVVFLLVDDFPDANLRHYNFMIEGLQDVEKKLSARNISFYVYNQKIDDMISFFEKAAIIITDKGYLRVEREWKKYLADSINTKVIEVEANAVVPVEEVSLKEEYSAFTIRKKIHNKLPVFLNLVNKLEYKIGKYRPIWINDYSSYELNINDKDTLLSKLKINKEVATSSYFVGGTSNANLILKNFIESKLINYEKLKNHPEYDFTSGLSPYLHFGQISPIFIYLEVDKSNISSKDVFLEELLIRRELAINFVYYNEKYDSYECLPSWAQITLKVHKNDDRKSIYSISQLEEAKTSDRYWNSAQKEMLITGKMNGYMRMYWGKKIIEWTKTPQEAYEIALYLNNKYNLDGRDANGFAGVAWCFGKHDRPWFERDIFGLVRYMNDSGLKSKFNMESYVNKVNDLR